MEFTAAVRYEVFENNNTNVAVPKFGMRWQPFDETFTVRATWGEGFREPSLIELYASPTSGLTASTDILPTSLGGPPTPVGDPSRFESETPVVTTSAPTLQPEDSALLRWRYLDAQMGERTYALHRPLEYRASIVVVASTDQVLNNEA